MASQPQKRLGRRRGGPRLVAALALFAGLLCVLLLAAEAPAPAGARRLAAGDDDARNYPTDLLLDQPYSESGGKGAVLLHIIGMCYMFAGLAAVCDGYFMAALEAMTSRWAIDEDVAGATFMAAGGSAPELFTSIMGVFVAESDVGFGTIVGSAVFNVLFVIGLCAVFAKATLDLHWWPLFRDCSFYIASLAVLAYFVEDQEVELYEALVLFGLYWLYLVLMKNNQQLKARAEAWVLARQGRVADAHPASDVEEGSLNEAVAAVRRASLTNSPGSLSRVHSRESPLAVMRDMRSVALRAMLTGRLHAKHAERLERLGERRPSMQEANPWARVQAATADVPAMRIAAQIVIHHQRKKKAAAASAVRPEDDAAPAEEDGEEEEGWTGEDDGPTDPFEWPETRVEQAIHVVTFPINLLLWATIPYCADDKWARWFGVTFVMSLVWIAAFSYCMVWWATIVGEALHIPTAVMGITFLAAGTSIPDALSSVFVARAGFGDMAVSSSIGSNIFDILVGLPVPWAIATGIWDPGSTVPIESQWLVVNVVTLCGMVFAVVAAIMWTGWKLDRKLGKVMFVLYVIFIVESLVLELELLNL